MADMSLESALKDFGQDAYLITVGDDGPHTSNVTVALQEGDITCALGNSAQTNIAKQANVSLFWPPFEAGGYGIVLNGRATLNKGKDGMPNATIALTKAVFHRPGPRPAGSVGPCKSDCRPLDFS